MAAAEDSDQVRLEDRPRLVLTEATLLEVARLGSVLPIAPPRQCPVEVQVGAASIRVTLSAVYCSIDFTISLVNIVS